MVKNNNNADKEPFLEVSGFNKKYKKAKVPAVSDVTFKVMPGEFHGFIGANGAGKTTTIKSLVGAYAKFGGEVNMFGHKHSSIEAKRRIGYIPESAQFPKGMSTIAYLKYMCYLSGMKMKDAKKFSEEKLKSLGLEKVMKRSPNTFSSGQKKKILLAQALVHDPDIIIMDEPAANLDPKARFDFFDELRKLQKKGKSIFISSHILAELDKFVDSVTIIDGGKIVFSGSIEKATENPDLEYEIILEEDQDFATVSKILSQMKLKSVKTKQGFVIKMIKRENIFLLMKTLATKKVFINTLKNKKMTLEEVYGKYAVLGSMETGTGKVDK